MANQLDLEEQEQLDQLKHFWKQYGDLITWALIAVLGAFAAWNGYQYWERNQATQAAAMYDEVERMAVLGDIAKLDRAFKDMQERYPSTAYAQQSGLLVAKLFQQAGKSDDAKAALTWVIDKSSDPGYQAIARLRLSGLLAQTKAYADAMVQLGGSFPMQFAGLVADRKGDILALQGKSAQARAEYEIAYKALDEGSNYRHLIEIKLNAMGADPRVKPAADVAATGAASTEVRK